MEDDRKNKFCPEILCYVNFIHTNNDTKMKGRNHMRRLDDVLRANESAGTGKRKKKKSVIPVYDMNGKTITPEKKKRESRIAVAVLVIGLTFGIYLCSTICIKGYYRKTGECENRYQCNPHQ